MKQAKLLLTAIAILTVIGGALAFKANTIKSFYSSGASGECDEFYTNAKWEVVWMTNLPGVRTTYLSTGRDLAHPCPKIMIITSP
ncbi:MAG: hypothetical protein J7623_01610 [Chitinophaga sp.]|nr:hypothetical protein [Chitinophaga sp.]